MNAMLRSCRQFLLLILILLGVAWASSEGYLWLLRWRAEKLLTDVRSLQVDRGGWPDAQRLMTRWGHWGTSSATCTPDACAYRISLIQALPETLVGHPGKGAKNWLPKMVGHLGMRSAAARAEFTVEHGVVTATWFGEQVTLPVQDWNSSMDYVPYLSASSGEDSKYRDHFPEWHPLHTDRRVEPYPNGMNVVFSPQEEASEQALLMDFRFSCITRLRPCRDAGEFLPEGERMVQELQHLAGTR